MQRNTRPKYLELFFGLRKGKSERVRSKRKENLYNFFAFIDMLCFLMYFDFKKKIYLFGFFPHLNH